MTAKSKVARWQFSIRPALIGMALLGILMAAMAMLSRNVMKQRFVEFTVVPITESYVSSVGHGNGRIVWLRVNNISPHHPNQFDE